jgi:hypothetical protein
VTSLIKADYNSSIVMSHLARIILLCAIAFGHGGIVSAHDDSGVIGDKDGNFDWKRRFTLVDDATNTDCGYPSSVLLKDGRVLTVYYAVGSKENPAWGLHCAAVTYNLPGSP